MVMVDISRLIVALSDYEELKWFIHEKRFCAQLGIDEDGLAELLSTNQEWWYRIEEEEDLPIKP